MLLPLLLFTVIIPSMETKFHSFINSLQMETKNYQSSTSLVHGSPTEFLGFNRRFLHSLVSPLIVARFSLILGTLKWRQIFTLRLILSLLFNSKKKTCGSCFFTLLRGSTLHARHLLSLATYLFSLPHISAFCYKCRVSESPLQLPSQMVAFWSTEGLGKNNIFTLHMTALTCIVQLFKQHKERGCFS